VGIGVNERALEGVDLLVPPRPDRLGDQLVDADDEHVLVVGAVEDRHFPPSGSLLVNPPEEIVSQLLGGRLLEADHAAPLRVHGAEDVVDRAVLAPRVQPLQADEKRETAVGVE
jgi:hypothetical protein